MKYDLSNIGKKIYDCRRSQKSSEHPGKRMSQEEFASLIGCSRKAISEWESSNPKKPTPPLEALISICEVFDDYDLDYFLVRSNEYPSKTVSEIASQIPLSGETIKGLRELMQTIQDNKPYSYPDGFGSVEEIDARILAGLIDSIISTLLCCRNVWGHNGENLLNRFMKMIIAREFHNSAVDEDGFLHGDCRLFEPMISAIEGSRYEFGREIGMIAEKYISNYYRPTDELIEYRNQENIKLPSWMLENQPEV